MSVEVHTTRIKFWCCKYYEILLGNSEDNDDIDLPLFDLAAVRTATKDFSPENMIGEGGFGPVYKVWTHLIYSTSIDYWYSHNFFHTRYDNVQGNLSTGQDIAMKRLSNNSRQGLKEFKNEVELIAKLQHKNLVALLGCCIQGNERILIYEYMPCKSLDHYIYGLKLCTVVVF